MGVEPRPKSSSKKFIPAVTNFIYKLMQLIIKSNQQIDMEDSLELPDQYDIANLQSLLSPEPYQTSREQTPPHSLAYSNSTCAKDKYAGEIQFRSPLAFENYGEQSPQRAGVIRANNENHPYNGQRTIPISPQKKIDEPVITKNEGSEKIVPKGQYKKVNPKAKGIIKSPPKTQRNSPKVEKKSQPQKQITEVAEESKEQRKTIDKGQTFKLKRRVKELEQALHMETVVSEELRMKVQITNSLLESKLKEAGLQFFFNLKNSSRDLKNIDIFVQMNVLQKTLTEKSIHLQRQKTQITEMQVEIERLRSRKASPASIKHISPSKDFNEQIERLVEEKQNLINYIEEQRDTMTRRIAYIAELEQQINKMGDKEAHYINIERPKFLSQLGDLKRRNRMLEDEIEQIKMEFNLTQMNLAEQNGNLKKQVSQLQNSAFNQQEEIEKLKSNKHQVVEKTYRTAECQKEDIQLEILRKELHLLKSERDYYLTEYRKRTAESAELYALQLKLSTFQDLQRGSQ